MKVTAIKFKSMINSMHCQRKYKHDKFDNNNDKGCTMWYVRVVSVKYSFVGSVQLAELKFS